MSLLYTNLDALSKCSPRAENDFYPTPIELVSATIDLLVDLLSELKLPNPKNILDIGCGDGIYCREAKKRWPNARTIGYDVIDRNPTGVDVFILEDYLISKQQFDYDLVIGNIPYVNAEELLTKAYNELKPFGVMQELLLLNFLGSQGRSPYKPKRKSKRKWTGFFGNHNLHSVYVCSRRPSFTGNGTDAREYANFVWHKGGTKEPILDWMQW